LARPDDENQAPSGFETSAELRRAPEPEAAAREHAPPASVRPEAQYNARSPLSRWLIAAAIVLVLVAVALIVYLAA
jgi:hypothetical protein